ncbi:hypothetical protein [uncultured Veillonella sp.]|uniref:hypothetical protein n=1 Tax=uncultured Veillonella sp. TaxID=159268 RepID=UPI0026375FE8|nr:hypothetical protein [uncultured Veillonella sp.]
MKLYSKLALRVGLGGIMYAFYGLFSMILGIYIGEDTNDMVLQNAGIILCLFLGGYMARKLYVKELSTHIELHKHTMYFFFGILFAFWALAEAMLAYHSLTFISFMEVIFFNDDYFGLNPIVYYMILCILLCIVGAYFFVTFLCAAASEWFVIKIKEGHAQYKEVKKAVESAKKGNTNDSV